MAIRNTINKIADKCLIITDLELVLKIITKMVRNDTNQRYKIMNAKPKGYIYNCLIPK